jgi:hypothetical protein
LDEKSFITLSLEVDDISVVVDAVFAGVPDLSVAEHGAQQPPDLAMQMPRFDSICAQQLLAGQSKKCFNIVVKLVGSHSRNENGLFKKSKIFFCAEFVKKR